MFSLRDIPIKRKLTVVILVTSSAALLLAGVSFIAYDMVTFRQGMVRDISSLASVISANSTGALAFGDTKTADETLSALKARSHVEAACLYSKYGKIIGTYERDDLRGKVKWPVVEKTGYVFEADNLQLFHEVQFRKQFLGTIYLRSDLNALSHRRTHYASIVGLVLLASLLLALLISARMQRVVSQPIQDLASVARVVTQQKDYSIRALKRGKDEMGLLIDAFNEMLTRIHERDEALHRANDELEKRVAERTRELQQELVDRKRAEEELRLLQSITLAVSEATDLEAALREVLRRVCEATGWTYGGAWVPAPEGKHLIFHTAWHNGSALMESFRSSSREFLLRMGEGLPGQVWESKKPVWVQDVAKGTNLPRAKLASEVGLRGGLAVPVLAGDTVIAVLELFVHEPREEDSRLLQLISTVAAQVGVVIQRRQAQEALLRTEEKFRQAQKMEAVGRLAGGVAHDFNNVLTIITGYSDILMRQLVASPPQHKSAEEINKAAQRAAGLTRQLLAFSRKQLLQPRVFSPNTVVKGMTEMLRRLIDESIELHTVFDPALGSVMADPGQVEQVILNLAVNARDAMPFGGKLIITTANIHNAAARDGSNHGPQVMISVRDTGVGMTNEVKAHLFEPFFTTKGKDKGTGLGLATCYGIVQQSGGHIRVESEPGQGTVFEIFLPMVKTEVEQPGPVAKTDEQLRGTESLLVVEDEPVVRELTVDLLQSAGYRVMHAGNGREALELVQRNGRHKFDLIVTDVIMPEMGGREMVERLKPILPDTRVLFTSGYTDDALAQHGVLDNKVAFLEKPFSSERLLLKVREVLEHKTNGAIQHA